MDYKTFRAYFLPEKITKEKLLAALEYQDFFEGIEDWTVNGKSLFVANFSREVPRTISRIPGLVAVEGYNKESFEDDGNYKSFRREGLEGTEPC